MWLPPCSSPHRYSSIAPAMTNATLSRALLVSVEAGTYASGIVAAGWTAMLLGYSGDRSGEYNRCEPLGLCFMLYTPLSTWPHCSSTRVHVEVSLACGVFVCLARCDLRVSARSSLFVCTLMPRFACLAQDRHRRRHRAV